MAATIFTSTAAKGLKKTLEKIITDGPYSKPKLMSRIMSERSMKDHWEDDLEVGGPGLIPEKTEGSAIQLGSIKEGYVTRYIARTFGMKLIVTDEMLEDNKYKEIIKAAQRLTRSMMQTVDVDATTLFMRGFNPEYVGGDGQPLWSNAHTLPHGGTFSNTLPTPMAPSRAAVTIARTMAMKLPGHNGIVEGYDLEKVVCPVEQWDAWAELIGSTHAPEAGEFNRINVVNSKMSLEVVENKYWSNSSTNYAFITDCDDGINFRWKRKPRSRTWVDNDHEQMNYSISARWARGWSNPRCSIGVQA